MGPTVAGVHLRSPLRGTWSVTSSYAWEGFGSTLSTVTFVIFLEISYHLGTCGSFGGRRVANRWIYSPFLAQPAFDLNFLLFSGRVDKDS